MDELTGSGVKHTNSAAAVLKSRRFIIYMAMVLIVVIAGWAVIAARNNKKGATAKIPAAAPAICKGDVLTSASAALATNTAATLQPVAQAVQKLPNYDKDPNCLYIVAAYDVSISDYENASTNLNKLKAIDPNGKKLNIDPNNSGKPPIDRLDIVINSVSNQDNSILKFTGN